MSRPVLATHSGTFHCDDAFAYATLRLAFGLTSVGVDHVLRRTRDPEVIAAADIVWDVGAAYDPATERFDHHQRDAPVRKDDGIPYSAAGLVWQAHGLAAVRALLSPGQASQAGAVAAAIDDDVIRRIDAIDNGVAHPGDTLGISALVEDCNPVWDSGGVGDDAAEDAAFVQAADIMQDFLRRRVWHLRGRLAAAGIVAEAHAATADGRILELNRKMPWQGAVFANGLQTLFAIYPISNGTWMVDAMPKEENSFAPRLPLPEAWAGLRGAELAEATGIADAVFVHSKRFIGAAGSRNGAIEMATVAISLAGYLEGMFGESVGKRLRAGEEGHAFRVCVHRGTREIGGTCIELSCNGARILLDLDLPLDAGESNPRVLLPAVSGLRERDDRLLAIVISHSHADHWGLAPYCGPKIRIVAGAATRAIMGAAASFVPHCIELPDGDDGRLDLVDRKTIEVGPFSITPFLVDHSAFDAYALLIEANGRRLFYSADIRGHGRKGALFERLIDQPPQPVHAMLMEGSSIGRLKPDEAFPSEADIEARLTERFRTPGFIGICASAQNVDRMVSLYRACKRTGRTLVLDAYAADVLAATGNDNIPKADWANVAVYIPEYQRRHIRRNELFDLLQKLKRDRVYRDWLSVRALEVVMLFRPAMVADIDMIPEVWAGARVIWSQWAGYLQAPAHQAFLAKLKDRGVGVEVIHTSGHASIVDLKRLASALAPDVLVPVHTFEAGRYPELFGPNVCVRADGEWWEV